MIIAPYAILVHPLSDEDGGGFLAIVPDLPGCAGDGETQEEAITDANLAIAAWIEAAVELKREIPAPGTALEKAKARNKAMIEAMKSLLDYADIADNQIDKLEAQLKHLLKLMQDDSSIRMTGDVLASVKETKPQHCH